MMWLIQTILMLTGAVTITAFVASVTIIIIGSRRPPEPINIPDHRDMEVVADELTEHDRMPMEWEHWEDWETVLK